MEKPFQLLVGNRVMLEIPVMPESKIMLSEETQQQWIEEQKLKLNKFKIYAVGDDVKKYKEGDIVNVDKRALAVATKEVLTNDLSVLMVSQFDISMVW